MQGIRSVSRISLIVSVLAVVLMVLAACGDDGGAADSDNGGGSDTSSEPTEVVDDDEDAAETEDEATEEEDVQETATEEVAETEESSDEGNSEELEGRILVDGSSTVYPVTQAMAEEYSLVESGVQIPVGVSGTGGGFEKFCQGETDISDASRPISPEEAELCAENGIEYVELPVAFDGLSVVVNPENDWVECLTVDQLNTIWAPESEGEITNWNQVDPSFPDAPLVLYGPGTDSGTYDYFTDVINGEEGASRGDFTGSEDDNVLVQGIAGDQNALGFFGYAYYLENQDSLKLVGVDDGNPDNGEGCVQPSPETINDGTYQPLSRPLFIYVKAESLDRPEVEAFVNFYLNEGQEILPEIGYVPLPEDVYAALANRVESRTTGSVFEGDGSTQGVRVDDLLFPDES